MQIKINHVIMFLMENLVLKPKYFDKFSCLKDDCPNSCCKDWKINIDNKTLKKYSKIKDKNFSNFIIENINASTNNVVLNKKVCPFLDDDCLCKIQKNCGENYLCKTCKSFPRFTQKNKNLTIYNLYLSCPNTFKREFNKPCSEGDKICNHKYAVIVREMTTGAK